MPFGPITGSYRIETQGMQMLVLWNSEEQVLNRQSRATSITFDIAGIRAGQSVIVSVQVQVTDRRLSVMSGVFAQSLVTANTPFRKQHSHMLRAFAFCSPSLLCPPSGGTECIRSTCFPLGQTGGWMVCVGHDSQERADLFQSSHC